MLYDKEKEFIELLWITWSNGKKRIHTEQMIFPSAAFYLQMMKYISCEEALSLIEESVRIGVEPERKRLHAVTKISFIRPLFFQIFPRMINTMFNEEAGFKTKGLESDNKHYRVDVLNGKIYNYWCIFVVEESYYETNGKRHASPHLFLITESENGILLSSYEIPEGEDKNTFSYKTMKNVDYSELKKSEKFTPALYHEKDGVWEGGSTSRFSPVMTFKLWEKFSDSRLEVSESMDVNGKRTFGYDDPIIYKRV